MTEHGHGGLVRRTGIHSTGLFGRRLMFRSLDSAVVSVSDLDLDSDSAAGARSAGFRLDRVTVSIPGGAGMAGASARSDSELTTAAVLLRCTAARGFRT